MKEDTLGKDRFFLEIRRVPSSDISLTLPEVENDDEGISSSVVRCDEGSSGKREEDG